MDYSKYYKGLKEKLIAKKSNDTRGITTSIKEYTQNYFNDKSVICTEKIDGKSEFLFDISVLNFDPRNMVTSAGNKISLIEYNSYDAYVVIESELGGPRATGPKDLFNNVLEDFSKVLLANSKFKIMIIALSPYSNEEGFINNRLDIIKTVYNKSECKSDVLLFIIEGNHTDGTSRQVKLSITDTTVHGYIMKESGYTKIK